MAPRACCEQVDNYFLVGATVLQVRAIEQQNKSSRLWGCGVKMVLEEDCFLVVARKTWCAALMKACTKS